MEIARARLVRHQQLDGDLMMSAKYFRFSSQFP